MRKINLILCIGLISTISYAQKFETNLNISPIVTFGSNKTTDSGIALGFSAGVGSFYKISNKLAIGVEMNYSITNHKLRLEEDYTSIFYSKINTQSLNIPLIIRYTFENNWFFQGGTGLCYILNMKSEVNHYFDNGYLAYLIHRLRNLL